LNEIRGYLHAIRGFKCGIKNINNETDLNMSSNDIIDSVSDDDNIDDFISYNSDNEDGEQFHKNYGVNSKNRTISSPLFNQLETYEFEFLSEFSSLEKNLDNLNS
jgi:hypothetical protein